MSVCVIIQGWADQRDGGNALTNADFAAAGAVVARCNPCQNTQRVVFPETDGVLATEYLSLAELKPEETYVLTFADDGAAQGWIGARAEKLAGKVVFKIDPAVMGGTAAP